MFESAHIQPNSMTDDLLWGNNYFFKIARLKRTALRADSEYPYPWVNPESGIIQLGQFEYLNIPVKELNVTDITEQQYL